MSSIARSARLCQPLGAIRKQHVATAVQSSKKPVEPLSASLKASSNDQTSSLSPNERAQLQHLASELNAAYQSGEPTEQHVVRALEVIRPMVRPLRKERKRQSDEMRKGGASTQGSVKAKGENFTVHHNATTNVRHIATQLHPKSSLPPLGCPLPLPLEKKHSDTLRTLLDPSAFYGTTQTNSASRTSPDLLSAWTRESLLRSQEALYDILLVRSTLTYWLYFARIQLKKTQRKALIDAITGIRNVVKSQLDIAGRSGKTKKPVIDNGLERYALFKYQVQSAERDQRLQAATSVAIPIQKQPLFSWDALFGGLSSVKQAYQREAFEAKARIISYSLSRGVGNELTWIPRPRTAVEKITFGQAERTEESRHPKTSATPSLGPLKGDISPLAFFDGSTATSSARGQESVKSPAVTKVALPPGDASTTLGSLAPANSLSGNRIPLEHLLQTSISWSNPRPYPSKASQETMSLPYSCPPKIQWSSQSHEIRQKQERRNVEKETYARFLDFVSSELSGGVPVSTRAQAVADSTVPTFERFKSHTEIFAVRSGIGKDAQLATDIWRSHWEEQATLLISTDGSSKADDNASVGVHIGTSIPVELNGALPPEWAALGSYAAEWFAICYALWLALDLQTSRNALPNISGRKTLVFCTDSSGIVLAITKPLRPQDKNTPSANKSWNPLVVLCRQMIGKLTSEGKEVRVTWMGRNATIGLNRAHELADEVYGRISVPKIKPLTIKQRTKLQSGNANDQHPAYRPVGWFCI